MRHWLVWLSCLAWLASLLGCDQTDSTTTAATTTNTSGDVTRGRQLLVDYQCGRCHDARFAKIDDGGDKACLGCHTAIIEGRADLPPRHAWPRDDERERAQHWDEHLVNMRYAPSLRGPATLMRPEWLVEFLRRPHDIRPRLGASMPRLALSEQDARDMVAAMIDGERVEPFFADQAIADYRRALPPMPAGAVKAGRALFIEKGCASCHSFSGVLESSEAIPDRRLSRAMTLAPDLRHTRERYRPMLLVPWLLDPRYHKPDASMPTLPLNYAEARHLAAFVMQAPLAEIAAAPTPARLPLLQREVRYDEVHREVFGEVCVHCHSEPDLELGDGGPGYSGGFGYVARNVSFASYEAVFGGRLGDDGRFTSLFELRPDGTPWLVAVLLARQREQRGEYGPLKGMPLGFPAVSPEQLQLVESWIAQGRLR